MRHLAADGRPIIEAATPGALHLLELASGRTAATSPGVAVEIREAHGRVSVTHWIAGEPFRVVPTAGRA